MTEECPNGDVILDFARSLGLKSAELRYHPLFGWELRGNERTEDDWPLVWAVVKQCNISWGCGGANYHQIKPGGFTVSNRNLSDKREQTADR